MAFIRIELKLDPVAPCVKALTEVCEIALKDYDGFILNSEYFGSRLEPGLCKTPVYSWVVLNLNTDLQRDTCGTMIVLTPEDLNG